MNAGPTPYAPSDDTSLALVLRELDGEGFEGAFSVVEGAALRCHDCDARVAAGDVTAARLRRLEGASDPADMLAVVALECPRCGHKGTVVLNYGPESTLEQAEVLAALEAGPTSEERGPRMAENGSRGAAAVIDRVEGEVDAYRHGEDLPIEGFAALMATYGLAVTAGGVVVRRRGVPADRPSTKDLVLLALATHRLSRLVSKDAVTSPLRSPFMRFEGSAGDGELAESVRVEGPRKAVGELLSCPFCIAQWIATALMFGLLLAPRATRAVLGVLAAVTASDYLQFVHAAAQRWEHAGS